MTLAPAKSFPVVLVDLAADHDVFVVSQDLGPMGSFASAYPQRAFDLGITEQNLIGVAAGIAARDNLVFVFAMAPFVSMRSFEQVRTDLAYNHKNVKVLAPFGGFTAGAWGATHHAMEDFALMRTIPGMTVLAPADGHELEKCLRAVADIEGPAYIRMGGFIPLHEDEFEFEVGRALTLREGADITIIACGTMGRPALEAHERLKARGVSAAVLDMHTIKPLDAEAVRAAAQRTGRIVTVEEHGITGGLGTAVAEVLAEAGTGRLARLGVRDRFCTEVGSQAELCDMNGLNAEGIEQAALGLVEGR